MELIQKYFPDLNERQQEQFGIMLQLYPEWNEKINVISRKDIENLEERHILHSLAIARFINFKPGSAVLDFGTGGGFPGIPLAVMFPETQFLLVDRTGKKLKVSRAVMPQRDLLKICRKNISRDQRNGVPNGLITLKGGDVQAELGPLAQVSEQVDLSGYFKEPFFETKKLLYTPVM